MRYLLPDFEATSYVDAFKKAQAENDKETDEKKKKKLPGLKDVLEGTLIYQDKHYLRIER